MLKKVGKSMSKLLGAGLIFTLPAFSSFRSNSLRNTFCFGAEKNMTIFTFLTTNRILWAYIFIFTNHKNPLLCNMATGKFSKQKIEQLLLEPLQR